MEDVATEPRSAWQRFIDFPLVCLIVGIVLLMAVQWAVSLTKPLIPITPKTPLSDFVRPSLSIVSAIVVYKLAIARLGAKPRDELPFDRAGALQFAGGIVSGALLFSIVVGIAALLGVYHIDRVADARDLVWAAFGIGLLPGFVEEIMFRGILFRWLEAFAGSLAALVLSSALFGLGHAFNPGATALSTTAVALEAGILFGGAYLMTRSLWLPVGIHAAWNFTQGEIFDAPVSGYETHGLVEARLTGDPMLSGGPFGLEASVVTAILLTAVGIAFIWRAKRRGNLVQWRVSAPSDRAAVAGS